MNYLEKTAIDGEMLIGRASFSWLYLLIAMAPLWLTLIVAYVALKYLTGHYMTGIIPPRIIDWGFVALLVIGTWRYLSMALPWVSMEIAVTTARVVYSRGLLARQVDEIAITRIQGINLNQTLLGRCFDFGSLCIIGNGVDQINLPPIAGPVAFRKAIQEALTGIHASDDEPFMG
jgi:uncharacterized membrane protein YdbT with pleckstrin-like domain